MGHLSIRDSSSIEGIREQIHFPQSDTVRPSSASPILMSLMRLTSVVGRQVGRKISASLQVDLRFSLGRNRTCSNSRQA